MKDSNVMSSAATNKMSPAFDIDYYRGYTGLHAVTIAVPPGTRLGFDAEYSGSKMNNLKN